jgi:hypothetical protein
MTVAARLYNALPYLDNQFMGDSGSVRLVSSPDCVQTILRTARGFIW